MIGVILIVPPLAAAAALALAIATDADTRPTLGCGLGALFILLPVLTFVGALGLVDDNTIRLTGRNVTDCAGENDAVNAADVPADPMLPPAAAVLLLLPLLIAIVERCVALIVEGRGGGGDDDDEEPKPLNIVERPLGDGRLIDDGAPVPVPVLLLPAILVVIDDVDAGNIPPVALMEDVDEPLTAADALEVL